MDRSLPRGHDSWTVTWCYSSEVLSQPWSQFIDNIGPLIDLRSKVTSSGRTLDGLWRQTKSHMRSFTHGVWEPHCFSLEELDSVSRSILSTRNSYWRSAAPAEVTVHRQLWVKGQVQKHVCGSETEGFRHIQSLRKSSSVWESFATRWRSDFSVVLFRQHLIIQLLQNTYTHKRMKCSDVSAKL